MCPIWQYSIVVSGSHWLPLIVRSYTVWFAFLRILLSLGKTDLDSSFHHSGGPVKLVKACVSVRNDLDNSFHHCGGSVKLVLWL